MALKPPLKRIVIVVLALLIAWPALIVLVATPTLEALLPSIYREQTGRTLRLGEVVLQPFALSATLRDASSRDPDGKPFWAFRELHVDVSTASLWRRAIVLDAVRLDGIELRVEQVASDRYNFSDILDYRATHFPSTEPTSDAPLPPLELRRIELGVTGLDARLPYIAEPLTAQLADLRLTIDAFTTRPAGYSTAPRDLPPLGVGLSALAFERLQVQSLRSEEPWDSTIHRFNLGLDEFTTVAEAGHPNQIEAHFADGGSLRWRNDLSLAGRFSSGELTLDGIGLRPVWRYLQPQLNFRARHEPSRLDLSTRYRVEWGDGLHWSLDGGRLALHGTDLRANDDPDTTLKLARLGIENINADSRKREMNIDAVQIDGFALQSWNRDTAVGLLEMLRPRRQSEARLLPAEEEEEEDLPQWQLAVADIRSDDAQVHWRASQLDVERIDINPLSFKLQNVHWPSTGPAQLQAAARINEQVQLEVTGEIDPGKIDGHLQGKVDGLPLTWANKPLGELMNVNIADGTLATQYQLQFAGGSVKTVQANGSVSEFALLRSDNRRRLAAWQTLRWEDLQLDLADNRLTLTKVALQKPFLEFRLYKDGTTNISKLMVEPAAAGGSDAPPDNSATEQSAPPMAVAVKAVRIADGKLNFRDDTLPRPFRALIGELEGDVLDISSEPGQYASVDLTGSVDGYAPVTLAGKVAPLAPKPALDLTLDFANLDLATFTPYSSTYAGYVIDHGQLSVQLAYQLDNDRIEGRNRIVVDQLQLGERVDSPKAMDLPLRLAIALLTDENGVMDLGVDISGDIDDPQFDLGGIVWKAFRNLIVKAATAPFRLLANLVGSDKKLDYIVFNAGSETLDATDMEKLNALRDAMNQRPELRLMVSGQTNDATDSLALQERRRDKLLLEAGLSEEQLAERGRAWRNGLEALYQQQQPDGDADALDDTQLADAVRDGVALKPTALRALAGRRALAVKRTLVTELGLAAERVFIDSGKRQTVQEARATLAVDAR